MFELCLVSTVVKIDVTVAGVKEHSMLASKNYCKI